MEKQNQPVEKPEQVPPVSTADGALPESELDKVSGGYIEQENLRKPYIEQDNRGPAR
ncbi:MAG: hypothetical protein AB7K24_22640 [Gemmataceae bacterium]